MNGLASQCSSGCESGWTMYLDHSASQSPCKRNGSFVDQDGFICEEYKVKHMEDEEQEEEEEEEDLSMVSDASSGPPHFNEEDEECDENGWFSYGSSATALAKKSSKRQKIKDQQHHQQQQLQHQHQHNPSLLDDTASSPLFSLAKINNQEATMENVLDFSQGFSATHFKGKSSFQKHYGLLKSSLPLPSGTNFRRTS